MITSKRIFDIIVSATALLALSPVFLVIAIAIRLEDGGPALFRQRRIGPGGTPFNVLKFRKFSNSIRESGSIVTLTDDDRYSRIGRWLERTKLNELPQLINVFSGHMSIVGPRPEILDFRHCFRGSSAKLLDYAPGIFGPSQSAFRNEAAMYPPGEEPILFYERVLFPKKAEIDLAYYPVATLRTDSLWIVRSLAAVLRPSRPGRSDIPAPTTASAASSPMPAGVSRHH